MNPTQLDQVRDALRRETEQLQPVGLGFETVQRRGKRRRDRGRALVAVAAVTCLAGAGVVVSHRPGGKHAVAVTSEAPSPPPALAFRVVDGEVGYATHFTASDGVTYAVSTAPGAAGTPSQPGQAIYSTKDGEHWTVADQADPWISDLAEGGGVLYAIGTAPGAANNNDLQFRVGASSDGGQHWTNTDLPFDQSAPNATVPLTRSASVRLARSASTTVALLTETFSPNLDALVAARTAGHQNVTTQPSDRGFDIVDLTACRAADQALAAGVAGVAATTSPPTEHAKCDKPPVLSTITWSDLGLQSGADLTRQEILVSTDGSHWDHATGPTTGFVSNLVAASDGFLLLADSGTPFQGPLPGSQTALFRSTDARTWTNVEIPADLNVREIAGDRIIGVDNAGVLHTSTDGGTTWTATNVAAHLPAGASAPTTQTIDAGPLGFAAVVGTDQNDQNHGHDYLLFSTDGITWSTSDLVAQGEPDTGWPLQVVVGADHVAVDFEQPSDAPTGPTKITTVLATPTR